jgi:hypothetical protein
MIKKIGFGLSILFVIIQLIRTEHEITPFKDSYDFVLQTNPPEDIQKILKTSCYACHSNHTKSEWYSQIAPISWYINDHINEARGELNFSAWGTCDLKKKKHKLEECWEEIEKGKMPLDDYFKIHKEVKLSEEDQKKLVTWLKALDLNPPQKENVLTLNNGAQWIPNIETTEGVNRILKLVSSQIDAEDLTLYSEIGKTLNLEMKTVFAQCTMQGKGHD